MIEKIKYRVNFIRRMIPYTAGLKKFFFILFAVQIALALVEFIDPVFYKIFIDDVIIGREINKLFIVIGGCAAVYAANILIQYAWLYAKNKLVNGTTLRVKKKIWGSFLRFPFSDYEKKSVGDMKMRLDDDTAKISEFAERQSTYYIISVIRLIAGFIIIMKLSPILSIFAICLAPVNYKIHDALSAKEKKLIDSNRENDQKTASWIHAATQGWRETRALRLEKYQKRKYIRYTMNFAIYYSKWINLWLFRGILFPKIYDEFIMKFGVYFIGGVLICYNKITIGELLVFVVYYELFAKAFTALSNIDAELQSSMSITDRLVGELEKAETPDEGGKVEPGRDNTIVFENVNFTYPGGNRKVLDDVSFRIEKGERVAIVGKSGCGKTTALKALVGMITPDSGRVLFSGVDIRDINIESLHRRVGYVMQENMLFNVSIRENLVLGREETTDEELIEACKKACIYDTITETPDGFDTIIGERGIKLSGGQKQRIVLARLFLRDVDVFIFDEATSALDQYSESIVHDAIRGIAEDKTVIVVAHRESSIALCDRKIEMGALEYCATGLKE